MKYNKSGLPAKDGEKVYAQSIVNGKSQPQTFAVLTYNNSLYDPIGTDSHRENTLPLVMKRTTSQTFFLYHKYLQTNNKIFFTSAQRRFSDGE